MNIHRYYCLGQLEQPCLGKNPGFMSTSRRRRTSQHSIKKIHCKSTHNSGFFTRVVLVVAILVTYHENPHRCTSRHKTA